MKIIVRVAITGLVFGCIFLVKITLAARLISPEELYGDYQGGGNGEISISGIMALIFITLSFPIGYYAFGKVKKRNIEKENMQNLKKWTDRLLSDNRTRNLAKRIQKSGRLIFSESENLHSFFSKEEAEKKEKEINNKVNRVAFIEKTISEYSGGWTEGYIVFEFKKKEPININE